MRIVMKKADARNLLIGVFGILFLSLAFVGVSFNTFDVLGAPNSSVVTYLNVSNAKPIIYELVVDDGTSSPPDEIELTANTTTDVVCTASIIDLNGWTDVRDGNISATIWRNDSNIDTYPLPDDDNYRYTNSTCIGTSACTLISATNASCNCTFPVQFFAYNGSWSCEFRVEDAGGNTNSPLIVLNDSINDTSAVQTLVGVATDGTLDFGDVAASQIGPEVEFNITNVGNVRLNFTFMSFGGRDDGLQSNASNYPNVAMICQQGGNISNESMRYSVTPGDAFSSMNATNTSPLWVDSLVAHTREDDNLVNYGNDTNVTYWRIQVPLTVGGTCEGTLIVSAYELVDWDGS